MREHVNNVLDGSAAGVAGATIMGWLPEMAALFTVLWTAIRVFEWAECRFFNKCKDTD